MLIRKFSPSKLKHLLPLSHFTHTYTYTTPVSNSHPSSLITPPHFLNPNPKTLPQFPKSFSTIPPLPLSRDGNYDESTSESLQVCPGCGISMQDSDPTQPGFFMKPSEKNPNYKAPVDKNPVGHESEVSDSLKRGFVVEHDDADYVDEKMARKLSERPVVCARCHSLRNYGRVKNEKVENLLPDFDFDYTVGRKLKWARGARTVVLMVVDAVDFDGSFPRTVAKLVTKTIDENWEAWKEGKSGNLPRVVLVVTKIDLLPTSVSPTEFEHWVRNRAWLGGATRLTQVHFVSAVKNWGLKNLAEDIAALAGPRGHVWTIGAQNAGKSTLINAIGKCVGGKVSHLTEAPVPGTTLGIVRVEGVLFGQAKLFDTPGLLHPHQITTRLTREEQKLVHIGKEVKPRTYRIKAGHSVHIAGLMRLDVEESSVDSIYVTVWASLLLPLHMGKTENASTMLESHFGRTLQPPIGEGRVEQLGKWVRKEFHVCGNSWESSCTDIAAGGLGWFAIGLNGEAKLAVWTYDGVDVSTRKAMIPHRSNKFEVTGFTVSKIVSKADQALNKQRRSEKKRKLDDSKTKESPSDASPSSPSSSSSSSSSSEAENSPLLN